MLQRSKFILAVLSVLPNLVESEDFVSFYCCLLQIEFVVVVEQRGVAGVTKVYKSAYFFYISRMLSIVSSRLSIIIGCLPLNVLNYSVRSSISETRRNLFFATISLASKTSN